MLPAEPSTGSNDLCPGEQVRERASGVREGQILADKYRIERVLGAGAMGVVVAAYHLGLESKVAIKFLMPEMLGNEEALARFAREARAAAKITNEHVTRVLDVGTLETGAPYMVMEFLDGVDLHAWLARSGPLPVQQAVDFVLQACEAIAEAHELGIVHRDLKPSNLFCVRRQNGALCIKVLDFGISKMASVGGSGAEHGHDPHVDHDGFAALHAARADGVGAPGRRAVRHLGHWRDAVRASHGQAAVLR